ncbi:carboxylesterase/lipase family protein [Usitatibacter palustris]|uniref:Carboxylic ester hydrolase n=1 Tax=Usitatibacter palustris TaxID=2732487 RepID=A0A6M4H3J6_9PROT|nr:carboxylesterase family protein [Usitatibacter palustris]QJR13648.1 Para-nitrobenzyl esterase [Usitatibacter palustris]
MPKATWTASLFAAAVLLNGLAHGETPATPARRTTTLGVIVGNDDAATRGTYSWKGIPYARPPVAALRWKAPADALPWTSPRLTQQFANACASLGRLYGPGLNNRYDATIGASLDKFVGSEDCLYLNIWRPATATQKLPVIVFVHGGSNITGYTADPLYDGAMLARTANAVVVTVNYRLGVLGFFRSPHLRTGDPLQDSGNFALLDIIKSLQFINRNIASFGGDAGNVSLMGESAGAVNVYALMTSPLVVKASPSLVHRVLPLSGGISRAQDLPPGAFPVLYPAALFETQANLLLTHLLIADGLATDAATAQTYIASRKADEIASYLRGKSADVVLSTVLAKLKPAGLSGSNPVPDGHVLPESPIDAIKAGHYLKVPVLAGNTRDEGKLFPGLLSLAPALGGISGRLLTDEQVFSIAFSYDPDAPAATKLEQWIPAAYLPTDKPGTGYNARMDVLNNFWFKPLRDNVLGALKTQQGNVWYYSFDWDREPAPFNEIFGAAHAFDLAFVFGNFGPSVWANVMFTKANRAGRLALSDAMMRSIGAFARSGDPNDASLGVNWPPWPKTLVFDATLTTTAIRVP